MCEASLKSKSGKKLYEISSAPKQQPPPAPVVSNRIRKGCCPKEIEKNYPLWASGKTVLITLCTFKHIPERGEKKEEKKKEEEEKKKGFFGDNSKVKKKGSCKIKLQEKIKEYKALLH